MMDIKRYEPKIQELKNVLKSKLDSTQVMNTETSKLSLYILIHSYIYYISFIYSIWS